MAAAKATGMWTLMDSVEDFIVPDDLAAAFGRHPGSQEHWEAFSPSARKQILAWMAFAKRPETRASRIATTANDQMCRQRAPSARGLTGLADNCTISVASCTIGVWPR